MEHAMHCLARLIRAVLGVTAIANEKLVCGTGLTVLGVELTFTSEGYTLRPAKEKAISCIATMQAALDQNVLQPGCAQKLAGRLCWSTQYLFHKLGRAMLRPIFAQKLSRCVASRLFVHGTSRSTYMAFAQMRRNQQRAGCCTEVVGCRVVCGVCRTTGMENP